MAYSNKKVIIYGVLGVLIALGILAFIPAGKEAQLTPYVTLDRVPGYGLQLIIASQEQAELKHVRVAITRVEVLATGGDWVEVWSSKTSWDLLNENEKSFTLAPEKVQTSYTKARLHFEPGPNKSNATLSNGQVLPVELQENPFEVEISSILNGEGVDFALVLRIGSGKSSTHILPGYRVQVVTAELKGEISGK